MSASGSISRHKAYLSLGSNLGDRALMLDRAEELIGSEAGVITARSQRHETLPQGFESDNGFINEALEIETELGPEELLSVLCSIEKRLGRTHKTVSGAYQDREIDIDIIFYDDLVLSLPNLIIPHPRMAERSFVLIPLNEIAPEFRHPVSGRTVADIMDIERLEVGG